MFRSWRLGSAFGVGIFVHWTFALLVIWVMISSWGDASMVLTQLGLIMAVFGCVVLHELGHSLAARHFGINTLDITLSPIGGVARLDRMSEKPWEELCIALAGPVVNAGLAILFLVIAGVFFLIWNAMGGTLSPQLLQGEMTLGDGILSFLLWLILANVSLGVFNLVPAFPMDGGRVLRAVLAMVTSRLKATEIAANIGAGLAAVFAVLALLSLNPMFLFVAAFVFFAGRQELAFLRHRENLKNLPAGSTAQAEPNFEDANPVAPTALPDRFTGILWDGRLQVWVKWQDGRPVGTIGGHPPE